MWRINRLLLKNITYLYSGLHQDTISIDFTKANQNSKLNLIIGAMGSGKSVILGHLQPFATFGTLDSRNSEDMILPEVDGLKEITFEHDGSIYEISHKYSWNKTTKSHSTKSYIEKDGKELNPNGNSSTFKEIIKLEFGIEQNFLRVLRLGPNVSNVINMKSTERKSFIASLMEDTEVYLMLYKKLSEEFRTVNASINAISNRLIQLSATSKVDMEKELSDYQEEYQELAKKIDTLNSQKDQLYGRNQSLCGNLSERDLEKKLKSLEKELESQKNARDDLVIEISSHDQSHTIESVSNQIGQLQGRLNHIHEEYLSLQQSYEEASRLVTKLQDQLMVQSSEIQLSEMKQIFHETEKEYQKTTQKLSGFHCKYTYHYLASFIDNLHEFQQSLEETSQYDNVLLQRVYHKMNQSLGSYVKDKLNKLTGRRVNLQKKIGNLQFSSNYSAPYPLFRAPMCPTEDCPYYRTHPITIQKEHRGKRASDLKIEEYQNEIAQIDKEISMYQEIPMLQKNLVFLSNQWKSIYPVLLELKVIEPDLKLIHLLTDFQTRNRWVPYIQLTDILEKCKAQMEYEALSNRYQDLQREIQRLESPESISIQRQYQDALSQRDELLNKITSLKSDEAQCQYEIESQEHLYREIQKRDMKQGELSQMMESIETTETNLREIHEISSQVSENTSKIRDLENALAVKKARYQSLTQQMDHLKMILSQIEYNQGEYQSLRESRETLKSLIDAVSSKEGIPLILVKMFLQHCKDIVNDLIQDVFEDDLEILDFNISETEFKIPYMKNGQIIDDIEYASQGQKSIIGIALSFALVRQSMFDYNIMLLDEIDGPLYKKDREKFISILSRQMQAIHADQVFLITHNNNFEGNPINIITTTEEVVDPSKNQVVIKLT